MTPQQSRRYRTVLVASVLALMAILLWFGRGALTPFIVGGILAYLLLPLVRRLEGLLPAQGRWASARRPLAIGIVYLVTVSLIILAVRLLVPPLVEQVGDLFDRGPTLVDQARARVNAWLEQYHALVPDNVEAALEANLGDIGSSLAGTLRGALIGALRWLLGTANVLIGLLALPIWLFYVLKDQERGARFFYGLFPPGVVGDARAMAGIVNNVLGRYIRGQLFLGLTIGVTSFIGLSLLQVPYALALALLNGLFELIPVLGPWLGAIPGVIITLAVAPDKVGLVILFYIGLQQVENVLLVPKVQGDAVDMNPAVIIMSLVIAGELFGVWGLLAAVPVLAIGRDLVAYLYRRFAPAAEGSTSTTALQATSAPREAALVVPEERVAGS